MNKEKESFEENLQNNESVLNESEDTTSAENVPEEENDVIETPTYEELLNKKDELESLLLRANADLDNAFKRTLSEVEKAHKYGTERLLNELLPVIDNLENAI